MKKRLIVLAAGAAMVVGGAVAAIPGGSAHGVTSPCSKAEGGLYIQGGQIGKVFTVGHGLTPTQETQLFGKADFFRFGPGGQLDTACG